MVVLALLEDWLKTTLGWRKEAHKLDYVLCHDIRLAIGDLVVAVKHSARRRITSRYS